MKDFNLPRCLRGRLSDKGGPRKQVLHTQTTGQARHVTREKNCSPPTGFVQDSCAHSHTGLFVGHLWGHLWMTKGTSRGELQTASASLQLGLEDEGCRGSWGGGVVLLERNEEGFLTLLL